MTNALLESDGNMVEKPDVGPTPDWRARCRRLARHYDQEADRFAHEFRGPLTVIKEYASLLEDDLSDDLDAEGRQYLAVIDDRTEDLNAMVDDLLNINRLQRGRLIPFRARSSARELVEELQPFIEKKAALKEAELCIDLQDGLLPVCCDSEMISHSLRSIAAFLLRFAGEPARLTLRVRNDDKRHNVLFELEGAAPRVSLDAQQAIYERVESLFSGTARAHEGLRIGLQVARAMVELNFGRLAVSTVLRERCSFSFALPVADPGEVLQRYVETRERTQKSLQTFCAICITLDDSVDDATLDDADRLLHRCVRPHELFLQVGPAEWGLVTPTDEASISRVMLRFGKAFKRPSRRCATHELPRAHQTCVGSWSAPTDPGRLPSQVKKLFPSLGVG